MSGNKTKIEGTLNATGVAVVMAAAFRTDPDGVFVATLTALKETTNERDAAREELSRLTTLRPAREWHEDFGVAVLWWPIDDRDGLPHEAPYCGSLLEVEPPFPFEFDEETGEMHGAYVGQHLFWTPLPRVKAVKP